ncbi:MAG TPA: hypothetical protein VKB10_02965 [Gaiellaceae bacterium]|nr:hypothetical protein [Gaiellaceae bacterium]
MTKKTVRIPEQVAEAEPPERERGWSFAFIGGRRDDRPRQRRHRITDANGNAREVFAPPGRITSWR